VADWGVDRLARAIAGRELSAREALAAVVERVEQRNSRLNALVTLAIERAADEAAAADQALASGEPMGPLHGVPFSVKDAIATAGVRSTGGAEELRDHVPAEDAPAVARLRRAGGVLFAKSNLPPWSADFETAGPLFGVANNPHDLSRTPGGSSGGAAAAVSAGLTGFELGTDIGGSLRVPAHFCGVYAHRPSFGLVPQTGYLDHPGPTWNGADLNVLGPIARSVRDLQLLLEVLADTSRAGARSPLEPARHGALSAHRVGVWLDDAACSPAWEVASPLAAAAEALRAGGARVEEARPPVGFAEASAVYRPLIAAAMCRSLPTGEAERVGGSHCAWLELKDRQRELQRRWDAWFREFDALLCPVAAIAAPPHGHLVPLGMRTVDVDGETRRLLATVEWCGVIGVAGLPATIVPVGHTAGGLPVGIQVVGPDRGDRTALFVAARLAELTGGYRPPPATPPGSPGGPTTDPPGSSSGG
jgi:amidase